MAGRDIEIYNTVHLCSNTSKASTGFQKIFRNVTHLILREGRESFVEKKRVKEKKKKKGKILVSMLLWHFGDTALGPHFHDLRHAKV